MSTLLLRLASPLQSWGISSKFECRNTDRMPSKSAIIGLVAASLGRKRNEDISDLFPLRFGIRIDIEGTLLRDYHTAMHPYDEKRKYVTNRYYLSDAVFLIGLEGDECQLLEIEHALKTPAFPLFLGRRSCPPEGKLVLGIREKTILEALQDEPWLASDYMRGKVSPLGLRIFIDADDEDKNVLYQRDLPISFNQEHRQFGFRRVAEKDKVPIIANSNRGSSLIKDNTNHDAFSEVGV